MSVFRFNLRVEWGQIILGDGMNLSASAEAKAHGVQVAQEIMRGDEVRKRPWQLEILDEAGTIVAAVPFASVDPTLDHLQPDLRKVIEQVCASRREVDKTMHHAETLIMAVNIGLHGKPRLVTCNGRRV